MREARIDSNSAADRIQPPLLAVTSDDVASAAILPIPTTDMTPPESRGAPVKIERPTSHRAIGRRATTLTVPVKVSPTAEATVPALAA